MKYKWIKQDFPLQQKNALKICHAPNITFHISLRQLNLDIVTIQYQRNPLFFLFTEQPKQYLSLNIIIPIVMYFCNKSNKLIINKINVCLCSSIVSSTQLLCRKHRTGMTSVETWNFSDFFSTISSIQSES